jgi:hypothetical protein
MYTSGQDKAVSLPRVIYQSQVRQHQAAERPRDRRCSGGGHQKTPVGQRFTTGFKPLVARRHAEGLETRSAHVDDLLQASRKRSKTFQGAPIRELSHETGSVIRSRPIATVQSCLSLAQKQGSLMKPQLHASDLTSTADCSSYFGTCSQHPPPSAFSRRWLTSIRNQTDQTARREVDLSHLPPSTQ